MEKKEVKRERAATSKRTEAKAKKEPSERWVERDWLLCYVFAFCFLFFLSSFCSFLFNSRSSRRKSEQIDDVTVGASK